MKKHLLFFLALFWVKSLMAGVVTEKQALQKAQKFMKGKSFVVAGSRSMSPGKTADETSSFYVFNAENRGGFVIVSGDDRTPEILGYADSGEMDMENLPSNVKAWLDGYDRQIKSLGNRQLKPLTSTSRAAVEPLIKTQWDQTAPYNLQCPTVDGKHCVTGCVATAIAQIMYYYGKPDVATPVIPAYTTYTLNIALDQLPSTTFNWSIMRTAYGPNDTDEGAQEVARLMRYVGQSETMNYNKGGSAASSGSGNWIRYFGYSEAARSVSRSDYTNAEWESLLYGELSEKRPVLYSGSSYYGGHAFVCDGYDGDGHYHFNWGWGGYGDGFFALSAMNPDGPSDKAYTLGHDAYIGLQPKGETNEQCGIKTMSMLFGQTSSVTRTSAAADFTIPRVYTWYNIDSGSMTGRQAFGLYKDGQLLKVLYEADFSITAGNDNAYFSASSVRLGAGLADGFYTIRHLYKPAGDTEWQRCNEAYYGHVNVLISGNTLSLYRSDKGGSFTVNSITVNGTVKSGKTASLLVNITNQGTTNELPLMFRIFDSSEQKISEGITGAYVDQGQTGDCEIIIEMFASDFPPGSYTVKILDAENETELKSEVITVVERGTGNLEGSLTFTNAVENCVSDNFIEGTLTVKNLDSNTAYDDDVYLTIYKQEVSDGSYMWYSKARNTVAVQIPAGEETVIPFKFEGLVDGTYSIIVNYYKDAENTFQRMLWSKSVELKQETVVPDVFTADVNGVEMTFKVIDETAKTVQVGEGEAGKPCVSTETAGGIIIPKDIEHGGNLYQVKEVASYAFGGCSGLASVTIPSSVNSIGDFAFNNCPVLKDVYSEVKKPFGIDASVFNGIGSDAVLHVPLGCKTLYTAIEGWNTAFSEIVEMKEVESNDVTYEVKEDNTVEVKTAEVNKTTGSVSIAQKVVVNNEAVTVTAIAPKAFQNVEAVKSVTIPATVKSIGELAFAGCKNLKEVLCLNPDPVNLSVAAARGLLKDGNSGGTVSQFDGVDLKGCTLYVLTAAENDYRNAQGWNSFGTIKPFAGMGDVNTDKAIDVSDVVGEVNQILGKASDGFLYGAGDMNADNNIDVSDVVSIVNVILGKTAGARSMERLSAVAETTASDHLSLMAGNEGGLSLVLDNTADYIAAQFDVRLSEGQTLEKVVKGQRARGHQLATAKMGEGVYRVLLYTIGDRTFSGQSGEVVSLGVAGEGDVTVENITFITAGESRKKFDNLSNQLTGIDAVLNTGGEMTGDAQEWYDLQGHKLETAPTTKGVYLKNGKKVVVK